MDTHIPHIPPDTHTAYTLEDLYIPDSIYMVPVAYQQIIFNSQPNSHFPFLRIKKVHHHNAMCDLLMDVNLEPL